MKRMLAVAVLILPFIVTNAMARGNVTTNSSRNGAAMNHKDAISIIMQDHDHIRKALGDLDKKLGNSIVASKAAFAEIKDFLVKHETMEQEKWYPELEKLDNELKDIISHLKKEEDKAGKAIKDIDATTDDKEWVKKVKVLIKDVDHHAKEEETKLFPIVKKKVDQATLNEIGEKLKSYHSSHQMKL